MSATRHQTSMLPTWKKPRLARLLHKPEIMKQLGGLVFLLVIPFFLLGCILIILSYTNTSTKEPSHAAIFSILGPVFIVLAFLSAILGCLRDGQYKESNLPTIGRLPFRNSFQNAGHITKDVSHFKKHEYDHRPRYKILTHSKPYYNILNHLKQNDPSVYQHDIKHKTNVLNCVKGIKSNKMTPSENVTGRKSSHLKGILKKPSNRISMFRPSNTTKTVDFALTIPRGLNNTHLKEYTLYSTPTSETIVRAGRILSTTGLLLWAVTKMIEMMDSSITFQTVLCRSKMKALRQVSTNI